MNRSKQNNNPTSSDLISNISIHDSSQLTPNILCEDFISADIDTPKPFIIKKLPAVEDENIETKKQEYNDQQDTKISPKEQKFPFKVLLGIFLILLGAYGIYQYNFYLSQARSNGMNGCDAGCNALLTGALGTFSMIAGIVVLIVGLIQG